MKSEVDWFGLWYKIIKERGENDRPTFGKVNLSSGEVSWQNFSHSEMDGVGAMIHYYEKTSHPITSYPSLRENRSPNFFELVMIFLKMILFKRKIKTEWIENNHGIEPSDHQKIEYYIFSQAETNQIETFCRSQKISTNSFYMNIASKYLLSKLSINGSGSWTLPVNLRPILLRNDIKSNHSSGVIINIKTSDSFHQTHQEVKESLKNREHWAIWWIHQIGRIVGYKGMKFLSNQASRNNFLIGSFSNLSRWDLPEGDIWVGAAPGSKNFPVSMMVMKANQRVSISLKVHPFILKEQSRTQTLLNGIVNDIIVAVA